MRSQLLVRMVSGIVFAAVVAVGLFPVSSASAAVPDTVSTSVTGPWVKVSWKYQAVGGNCNGRFRYEGARRGEVGEYYLDFDIRCKTWVLGNTFKFLDTEKKMKGSWLDGGACERHTKSDNKVDGVNGYTQEGSFSLGDAMLDNKGNPQADGSNLCVPSLYDNAANISALGTPPGFGSKANHTGECPYGKPVSVMADVMDSGWGNNVWRVRYMWDRPQTQTAWYFRYLLRNGGGASTPVSSLAGTLYLAENDGFGVRYAGEGQTHTENGVWFRPRDPGNEVIGVQMVAAAGLPGEGILNDINPVPGVTEISPDGGRAVRRVGLGVTDPGICAFYFGPKLWNNSDPNDATDDPFGSPDAGPEEPVEDVPLEDPSAPADDPSEEVKVDDRCDFKITDPSTWASAGMCAAVGLLASIGKLLGKILTTLIGLPTAIGGAFADLLRTLFLPDVKSWGLPGLRDQFIARPPGSLVGAAASGTQAVAHSYDGGGCGVLADFTSADTHGDAKITCSRVTSVPGWSVLYSLVQVALYLMTGLAILRMFMGTFSAKAA